MRLAKVRNASRKSYYNSIEDFGTCGETGCLRSLQARVDAEAAYQYLYQLKDIFALGKPHWWRSLQDETEAGLDEVGPHTCS